MSIKTYKIFKLSNMWSTTRLTKKVESTLTEEEIGWEIVSVAFGTNIWMIPTAYITMRKKINHN